MMTYENVWPNIIVLSYTIDKRHLWNIHMQLKHVMHL